MTFKHDRGETKLVPLVPKKSTKNETLEQYTMAQVAKKCTPEELWIIVQGRVYDVTNYVEKHPGGRLVLHAMGGKDCTDVFANYHQARVYQTMLPAYCIGEIKEEVEAYLHVKDFRQIEQDLLQQGLFETNPHYYHRMYMWLASLFLASLYCSLLCSSTAAHMVGAVLMGFFWQQFAGVGHDVGHSSVSHNFYTDHWNGSLFGCLFMGISTGWWKRTHNLHHVVCNSIENDPDIQHMPVLAVQPKIIEKPFWSNYHQRLMQMDAVTSFFVRNQHILFFPLMGVARFNLYIQSWIMIFSKDFKMYNRGLEAAALTTFLVWVLAVALCMNSWAESVAWVLLSHAVAGVLHIQIVISHWTMECYRGSAYNNADDEWYKMQLATTMNIDCYEWMDFLHIGLQFQIEHHLFPMLPRHNLRIARKMVKEVCQKHGIPYHEKSFFGAVRCTYDLLCVTAAEARARGHTKVPNLIADGMNAQG
eukprot:CAMPEP_0194212666 /NCGR_PEP_ID=MMETSP0156-20130528/12688_1 /TAXON_ID=33649 /ORGANISM="Thalassionema nitzschioides, Strain L26-B" /LENGTH=474 /DNA_ID=CAMNT_0038940537 /DNA_START=305 /DNA_END=1729 /DNA_ORIENTATION=-